MTKKSDEYDLEPLLNTQQNDLTMVNAQGDGIDNKALALLAVDVTVLIFIVDHISQDWRLVLAGVPFATSIIFACLALQSKKYMGASIDLDKHEEYLAFDRQTLLLQLLSDTQKAVVHNQRINRSHWRRTLISAISAVCGAIVIVAIL